MKKKCTVMTRASVIKRNEEMLKKMIEENKKLPSKQARQAVRSKVKSLTTMANDNVGRLETQCIVRGEKSKEKFVGKHRKDEIRPAPSKATVLPIKDILALTNDIVMPEVSVSEELREEVRLVLKLDVVKDQAESSGSWLRSITKHAIDNSDLSIPSAINQLKDMLVGLISSLGETGVWVDALFGGRQDAFLKYLGKNISPTQDDEKGKMIREATAKALMHPIHIFSKPDLANPVKLAAGNSDKTKSVIKILSAEGRVFRKSSEVKSDVGHPPGPFVLTHN